MRTYLSQEAKDAGRRTKFPLSSFVNRHLPFVDLFDSKKKASKKPDHGSG